MRWLSQARNLIASGAERLSTELWFVPSLLVAAVVVLAIVLAQVDDVVDRVTWLRFPGGPQSARSVLSSIAGAMITFTGLVFSITILVLQLASQQFSPRILRTFLRDRTSQVALGMFAATFTYALITLRQVTPSSVPSLSVTAAVVLVLVSVGVFVAYINHIAQSIRVSTIVSRVAEEARRTIDREYPDEGAEQPGPYDAETPPAPATWVRAGRDGVLTRVDVDGMVEAARELGVVFEVAVGIGAFVPAGAPVIAVRGRELDDDEVDAVTDLFTLSQQRTMQQDAAFGIRRLVDIAEHALSPSINDPTTAVEAIDRIHGLLRLLLGRRLPDDRRVDDQGELRVVVRGRTWDEFLTLAVTEIRSYGAGSVQVHRRLRSMLLDLRGIAPASRASPIERELAALDAVAVREFQDERDLALARQPDERGLG